MVEQRSWPRLIVEALVIVFSILLALILDAAWEERSERVQEGELIERLADESRENRRSLEQVVSENRRSNAVALTLGSMNPESLRSISDDSLQTLIRGMSRTIFDPVQAESVSMIQSGDFRLIRSRDLRAALLGWTQAVVVAEEQVSYLLERIDERVEIFTAAGFYSALTRDQAVSSSEYGARRAVLTQLFREGRFQENLLSHRLFRIRYLELLEDAMAKLDRLLVLLEPEGAY